MLINQYAGSPQLGMEYRPHWLAREWMSVGHDVVVVTADRSHLRTRNPAPGWSVVEGVPFVTLPTTPHRGNGAARFANILSFRLGLYAWSAALRRLQPDIVIASSTHPMDVRPALGIAEGVGGRFVYEIHDLWPLTPRLLGGMSARHPMIMWMQREEDLGYRRADLAVSLLPNTEPYMEEHGLRPGRWRHVPNGAPLRSDLPEAPVEHLRQIAALRERYPVTIAYTGGHTEFDNIGALLDLSQYCATRGVGIVLVGTGSHKEILQTRYGHEPNVRFLEPVERGQVPAILAAVDFGYIAVIPSDLYRHGVAPNKLYDYMGAGLPVIENLGPAGTMVSSYGCGVHSDPADPQSLIAALDAGLGATAQTRGAWGDAGRRAVVRDFSQEVLAARFMNALEEIA